MAHSEELWQEARRKCRLNEDDLALARRLGLNPLSLIKNIPSRSEPWKAPVKAWLREIDARQQEKSARKRLRKGIARQEPETLPD
ncbi:MAG: hypothetical protein LBL95_05960 [Deltaproteobacteria bacterium]|nr:hypothetical protein [Deltaproteobacteria bacterium]